MILSTLLHFANREIQNHYRYREEFYRIKDIILKKHGKQVGYDVQHFKGKRCWSCNGTGEHVRYSNYPPYRAYDWSECWSCNGSGFYRMPLWVCLDRIQFGRYVFHKPLKRELHIGNPFNKKNLGWEVSANPIIEGRIEHEEHWFGEYALLLILFFYSPDWKQFYGELIFWKKLRITGTFKKIFRRPHITITMPKVKVEMPDDELPF